MSREEELKASWEAVRGRADGFGAIWKSGATILDQVRRAVTATGEDAQLGGVVGAVDADDQSEAGSLLAFGRRVTFSLRVLKAPGEEARLLGVIRFVTQVDGVAVTVFEFTVNEDGETDIADLDGQPLRVDAPALGRNLLALVAGNVYRSSVILI